MTSSATTTIVNDVKTWRGSDVPWSRRSPVVVLDEAGRCPGRRRCPPKHCSALGRTSCRDVDRSTYAEHSHNAQSHFSHPATTERRQFRGVSVPPLSDWRHLPGCYLPVSDAILYTTLVLQCHPSPLKSHKMLNAERSLP